MNLSVLINQIEPNSDFEYCQKELTFNFDLDAYKCLNIFYISDAQIGWVTLRTFLLCGSLETFFLIFVQPLFRDQTELPEFSILDVVWRLPKIDLLIVGVFSGMLIVSLWNVYTNQKRYWNEIRKRLSGVVTFFFDCNFFYSTQMIF